MKFDHRISLQKLEILCLVFELGGVRQAAEHVFVSQPVVSAHLKSLETYVGSRLFYREGRRLALTEAGLAVHSWARRVLSERASLERHLDALTAGGAGRVSISASMTVGSYVLPPLLCDFKKQYPRVQIQLLISDPEAAIGRVEGGICEFGLVMTEASIDSDLFVARQITVENYVLIAAPDSDLPAHLPVGRLKELPAVCPPSSSAVRRLQDAALREAGVYDRPIAMELGTGEAIKDAVKEGIGVALISHWAVGGEVARGELRQIEIEDASLTYGVTFVQRQSMLLSPVQQALADLICSIAPDG